MDPGGLKHVAGNRLNSVLTYISVLVGFLGKIIKKLIYTYTLRIDILVYTPYFLTYLLT